MRIHVIFSTKERQGRLREEFQPKLWAYIAGIARNHGFEAIEVGGVWPERDLLGRKVTALSA
jgi:hypothetical protein